MFASLIDIFFALLRLSLRDCHWPTALTSCDLPMRTQASALSNLASHCERSEAIEAGSASVIPGTDPGSPFPTCHCEAQRAEAIEALPIASPLTAEQWKQIFVLSKKQSLLGLIYSGIQRLPENLQPPSDLMDRWSQLMLKIMASNSLMNGTAAKLTQLFAEHGRKTIILKGQANALLYPDPYVRQAGDIDILVEGGRSSVLKLLNEMGVMEGVDFLERSNLHVHLTSDKFFNVIPGTSACHCEPSFSCHCERSEAIEAVSPRKGVPVEVHFAPTYNNSPFTTRTMCDFLAREASKPGAVKLSTEGFNVPPITFALVMQLSHLQRHYFDEGVGLRQIVDYHQLLTNSTQADRDLVRDNLRKIGLYHMAQAVMWVMGQTFKMPREQMLCDPDETRGTILLDTILEGGNFGKHFESNSLPALTHFLVVRSRAFRNLKLDIPETLWSEINYAKFFVRSIPTRIKQGKTSLRK